MSDSELATSFEAWRRLAELGAIVVVIGIAGEVMAILLESHNKGYFKEWWDFRLNPKLFGPIWGGLLKWLKPRKLRIEFLSVVLVVGGLVIEISAGHEAYIASDRQTSYLKIEAFQAYEHAQELMRSNLVLAAAVEELRSNNMTMEAELQPRIIPELEVAQALSKYSGTMALIISSVDNNSSDIATQLLKALRAAKWECGDVIFTAKPVPDGISVGECSTNMDFMANLQYKDESLQAACDISHELNQNSVDAVIDPSINFETHLRFNGVLIIVGSVPVGLEAKILKAEIEWDNAIEREQELSGKTFTMTPELTKAISDEVKAANTYVKLRQQEPNRQMFIKKPGGFNIDNPAFQLP